MSRGTMSRNILSCEFVQIGHTATDRPLACVLMDDNGVKVTDRRVRELMNRILMAMTAAAVIVTGGIASAQSSDRASRFLAKADVNGDGSISSAEALQMRLDRFDRSDANNDGALTLAEFQAAAKKPKPGRLEKRFGKLDRDGNGVISRSEVESSAAIRFARMDADGNGALTLDELKTARSRRGS